MQMEETSRLRNMQGHPGISAILNLWTIGWQYTLYNKYFLSSSGSYTESKTKKLKFYEACTYLLPTLPHRL